MRELLTDLRYAGRSLQTQHLFTAPGEYDVTLSFQKTESEERHSVTFSYRIRDRRDMEIPEDD